MNNIPKLLWAQDSTHLFVTVDIRDIKESNTSFTTSLLKVDVTNETTNFKCDFELNKEIIGRTNSIKGRFLKLKSRYVIYLNLIYEKFKNYINIDYIADLERSNQIMGYHMFIKMQVCKCMPNMLNAYKPCLMLSIKIIKLKYN